jgi:hypothetical protein
MAVNNELKRVWKEEVIALLEALCWNLPGKK